MSVTTIVRAVPTPSAAGGCCHAYRDYLQNLAQSVSPHARVEMSPPTEGVAARVTLMLPDEPALVTVFCDGGDWSVHRAGEERPVAMGRGDHRDALLALEVLFLLR